MFALLTNWFPRSFLITKEIIDESKVLPLIPEKRTPECPQQTRGFGRTTWLFDQIIEQLSGGNDCVFVGEHWKQAWQVADELIPKVRTSLNCELLRRSKSTWDVLVPGGPSVRLTFISKEEYPKWFCGRNNVCEFWDHFAVREE